MVEILGLFLFLDHVSKHSLLHSRACVSNVLRLGVLVSLGLVCRYWSAVVLSKLLNIFLLSYSVSLFVSSFGL